MVWQRRVNFQYMALVGSHGKKTAVSTKYIYIYVLEILCMHSVYMDSVLL